MLRQMDLHHLVAQVRQSLDRIHRVHRDEMALIDMLRHLRPSLIQCFIRIVAHVEANQRIKLRAALSIGSLELVEPLRASRTRTDANLQQMHFRRQRIARPKVCQQIQKLFDIIGDRQRIVPIRPASRQRLIVALPRRVFPRPQMPPVELVELPNDAVTHRAKVFYMHPLQRMQRLGQIRAQPLRHHLPGVHVQLHQRRRGAIAAEPMCCRHHIAKILLVLNPVQFDLQPREATLIELPFRDHRINRLNHSLRRSSCLGVEVVEFENHGAGDAKARIARSG